MQVLEKLRETDDGDGGFLRAERVAEKRNLRQRPTETTPMAVA
ncbi:hypothetical protein A2U01_0078596, partial [Trifolium medium]|nr:hypothetical protein [Trifolium medium]